MAATLARVNAALRRRGIPLELVRGEGYHYFVFDDGERFETVSEMVGYTSHVSLDRWIEWAEGAMIEIRKRLEE